MLPRLQGFKEPPKTTHAFTGLGGFFIACEFSHKPRTPDGACCPVRRVSASFRAPAASKTVGTGLQIPSRLKPHGLW